MSGEARAASPPQLGRAAGKRKFLKRLLFWLVGVCSLILLLIAGVVLFKDAIIRVFAERRIKQRTGLEVHIGEISLGLRSSSLLIRNFRIYNSKEFGGTVFLHVPEIYMAMDPEKTATGLLRFKELRFNLSELNVVRNRKGELNIESIERAVAADSNENEAAAARLRYKFGGIDKMVLSLRTIRFTDMQQPRNNYETDLGIQNEEAKNIKNEEELKAWAILLAVRIAVQEKYKAAERPRSRVGAQTLLELLKAR
jgi:hypothetical protein